MKNHDVTIIGAGLCGLFSALRLIEAKNSVCILERSASPGGKISRSGNDKLCIDGALPWLPTPPKHTKLDKYFQLLYPTDQNLIFSEFNANELAFFKRNHTQVPSAKLDELLFDVVSDVEDTLSDLTHFAEPLSLKEALSYDDAFQLEHENIKRSMLYSMQPPFSSGKIESNLGPAAPFLEKTHHFAPDGIIKVINHIIKKIKHTAQKNGVDFQIIYSAEVTQIQKINNTVITHCKDHSYHSKSIICTLTGEQLTNAHIEFEPPLDPKINRQLQAVKSAQINKLLIYYKSPFNFKKKYLIVETENPDRPLFFLNYQEIHPEKPPLLVQLRTDYHQQDQSLDNLEQTLNILEKCINVQANTCDYERCKTSIEPTPENACIFSYLPFSKKQKSSAHAPPIFFANEALSQKYHGNVFSMVEAAIECAGKVSRHLKQLRKGKKIA